MVNPMFLRRFFLPSASAFVVYAKSNDDNKTKKDGKKDDKKDKDGKNKKEVKKDEKDTKPECEKLVKAVDLPIYSDYKGNRQETEAINENSVLITTIRCMRQELCFFMEQVQVVKQELSEVYLTGKAHTLSTIDYLRDPDNVYPRAGAISAGALTGYLLALRKGKFKKLVFMGAGAGAVSAVLYPQEAQYYCEEALKVMKKYVIIAYHFFNGVSRDLTGWELPSLPNGHHLSVTDGHQKESGDTVPEPSHLLPPTVTATHIHLHSDEVKK